jgi:hypothetical protein
VRRVSLLAAPKDLLISSLTGRALPTSVSRSGTAVLKQRYLTMTPELLAEAALRFAHCAEEVSRGQA